MFVFQLSLNQLLFEWFWNDHSLHEMKSDCLKRGIDCLREERSLRGRYWGRENERSSGRAIYVVVLSDDEFEEDQKRLEFVVGRIYSGCRVRGRGGGGELDGDGGGSLGDMS